VLFKTCQAKSTDPKWYFTDISVYPTDTAVYFTDMLRAYRNFPQNPVIRWK
jgi:hypothetical protein